MGRQKKYSRGDLRKNSGPNFAKCETVSNAIRLHFPSDFTLSFEPVIHVMTVALPAANEQVIGTKTNLVLQHRLGKPVMDNDWGVHRDHLNDA